MGRIVAISSGDLESTKSINEYAIRLIHSESRNVLFLGTASKDSQGYIEGMTEAFAQFGCRVRALQLVTKNYTYEEIRAQIEWADIIYVGGGDTIFMGNVWKKFGADKLLKEAYEKDSAVFMGISAGAICWFACGCTDSELAEIKPGATYGWANDMLNIHKFAFCPHYEDRVQDFEELLKEKELSGLALESNVAFVEENGSISYIKSREEARGYLFSYRDGRYEKKELCLRLVE